MVRPVRSIPGRQMNLITRGGFLPSGSGRPRQFCPPPVAVDGGMAGLRLRPKDREREPKGENQGLSHRRTED
jgi:hypothetical protein